MRKTLPKDLTQKIAVYSAAGVTAAVGGINMADAEVADSTVTIVANAIGDSFDFDVDGDGIDDFNISVTSSFNGANLGGASASSFFILSGLGSNMVGNTTTVQTYNSINNYIGAFNPTTSSFGPTNPMTDAGVMFLRYPGAGGDFYGSADFGLAFNIGGETHFGGAIADVDGTNALVMNFQWETVANRPYTLQAVPEPSSVALLALGATGLIARRKRKTTDKI